MYIEAFLGAFFISLICSMGGLSGSVILLPFQILVLGINSITASAQNFIYNIIATPLGVITYIKNKIHR